MGNVSTGGKVIPDVPLSSPLGGGLWQRGGCHRDQLGGCPANGHVNCERSWKTTCQLALLPSIIKETDGCWEGRELHTC